ncbi:hypothetical protein N7495_000582 [Penicillium taxi]|uniref:uncharacterized protein n=1 Tax=Penicillium taxi TaxID=168475 RepID=UPI0025450784|nr:uncharacterized protein N7495_000582 [Penicillium taxi]KAJ5907900.1 hypothetical protein N7495_000582 [Penicillium taxi]
MFSASFSRCFSPVCMVAGYNIVCSLNHKADAQVKRSYGKSSLLELYQVAVLNSGQFVELGQPQELLNRAGGKFATLLELES